MRICLMRASFLLMRESVSLENSRWRQVLIWLVGSIGLLVCLLVGRSGLSGWSIYWSICWSVGLSVDLTCLVFLFCLVDLVYLVGLVCLMVCLLVYLASLVCLLTSMLVGCLFICLLVCLYDLYVGPLVYLSRLCKRENIAKK